MQTEEVPKLRFKEFSGEWEEKRFGEICQFKQGYQISFSEQINYEHKGYRRYLYISDFFTDKKRLFVKHQKGMNLMTKDNIAVANTGNTAGSFYKGREGILSNNMFYIKIEKSLNSKFLYNFLESFLYKKQLKKFFNSGGHPHLGHKNMSRITIPLTSLSEQRKITLFLSIVDEKIEKTEEEKELWETYKKGLIQKIFSRQISFRDDNGNDYPKWEEKRIKDIFDIKLGQSKSKYISEIGNYIIVDMGGISSTSKLIANKFTNYSKDFLTTNDLVMPKDDIGKGLIIGKVTVIPENNKYICGDHIYKLSKKSGNIIYLAYSINSFNINKQFRRKANGTAQIGLKRKEVDNQKIPFPSLPEQQKIALFLSEIDGKIGLIEKELNGLKKFKKGLLQQIFA